jgi:hypothetical protein
VTLKRKQHLNLEPTINEANRLPQALESVADGKALPKLRNRRELTAAKEPKRRLYAMQILPKPKTLNLEVEKQGPNIQTQGA